MPFLLLLASLFAVARAPAAEPSETDLAEAQRLYERATAYVSNITEGEYSYAYLQFYWRRSQANLERILRVYPETPIARQLAAGELQLGPFELDYFRERVLPRVEVKRLAAFDAVNCAILLFNLDRERADSARAHAFLSILEVLVRQRRYREALGFPVRPGDEALHFLTIFQTAVYDGQDDTVEALLLDAPEELRPRLWPIVAEGLVLLGRPRTELAALLDEHPEDAVKLAALRRMVDREILIQRTAALRLDIRDRIQLTHIKVLDPSVRDNVPEVARLFFPNGHPAAAVELARLQAGLGERPAANAPAAVHLEYLDYLTDLERFDDLAGYLGQTRLSGEARHDAEFKLVELWARAGRMNESEEIRQTIARRDRSQADLATLAQFRGQMESRANPLTVREATFANLRIDDPCVLIQAIMEWSLTANRSIRGASPWDHVVLRFLPGFENLPLPEDDEVAAAAAASPMY